MHEFLCYAVYVNGAKGIGLYVLIIHEENTKEIMKEGVCIPRYTILLIFTNFNFDFLLLYTMYFQNCFANRSIKLVSFTSHLQNFALCTDTTRSLMLEVVHKRFALCRTILLTCGI